MKTYDYSNKSSTIWILGDHSEYGRKPFLRRINRLEKIYKCRSVCAEVKELAPWTHYLIASVSYLGSSIEDLTVHDESSILTTSFLGLCGSPSTNGWSIRYWQRISQKEIIPIGNGLLINSNLLLSPYTTYCFTSSVHQYRPINWKSLRTERWVPLKNE